MWSICNVVFSFLRWSLKRTPIIVRSVTVQITSDLPYLMQTNRPYDNGQSAGFNRLMHVFQWYERSWVIVFPYWFYANDVHDFVIFTDRTSFSNASNPLVPLTPALQFLMKKRSLIVLIGPCNVRSTAKRRRVVSICVSHTLHQLHACAIS